MANQLPYKLGYVQKTIVVLHMCVCVMTNRDFLFYPIYAIIHVVRHYLVSRSALRFASQWMPYFLTRLRSKFCAGIHKNISLVFGSPVDC